MLRVVVDIDYNGKMPSGIENLNIEKKFRYQQASFKSIKHFIHMFCVFIISYHHIRFLKVRHFTAPYLGESGWR